MSHQAHSAQAIAEQRQAELVAAAAQYRLARGHGTTPLRPRGRRAARQLVGRFGRQHATA
jgi:hypothetical protein